MVKGLVAGLLLSGAALVAMAGASAQTSASIPNFAPDGAGWETANGTDFIAVPGSPPINKQDPTYPYVGNGQAIREGKQPTYRVADLSNPNIKQWAKDIMQKDSDEVKKGKIAFTPGQSCVPWGVPYVSLSGGPFYFVQTPKIVYIIEEGDRQTRHVYMDQPHSANLKPTWYGESVGRYEGDTLVVDTIGFNTKTFVDNYRTPHSDKLHVVERYRMIEGGKKLELHMTVEDPETYNQPWQAIRRYDITKDELGENICQEGNFVLFDYGIPVANKPDF
jgi:hypothetical protein